MSLIRKFVPEGVSYVEIRTSRFRQKVLEEEMPERILDHRVRQLCNKIVLLVRILWSESGTEEVTWGTGAKMLRLFPSHFRPSFWVETYFRGGVM